MARKRLVFSPGRMIAFFGGAATLIGLIFLIDERVPPLHVVERISEGIALIGQFWGLVPHDPIIGAFHLGHVVIILTAVLFLVLLLFRRASPEETEVAEFREEQRKFREEQKRFREEQKQFRDVQRQLLEEQKDLILTVAKQSTATLTFADADVVNAPIQSVWSYLRETECGPTCRELLPEMDVHRRDGDVIAWEGTGLLSGRQISVVGETRLHAPTGLSVRCLSGALRGFSSTFELEEEGSATKVKSQAEFSPSLIPTELADLANELSDRVPGILEGNLRKLREKVEPSGDSPPRGDPVNPGTDEAHH